MRCDDVDQPPTLSVIDRSHDQIVKVGCSHCRTSRFCLSWWKFKNTSPPLVHTLMKRAGRRSEKRVGAFFVRGADSCCPASYQSQPPTSAGRWRYSSSYLLYYPRVAQLFDRAIVPLEMCVTMVPPLIVALPRQHLRQ